MWRPENIRNVILGAENTANMRSVVIDDEDEDEEAYVDQGAGLPYSVCVVDIDFCCVFSFFCYLSC